MGIRCWPLPPSGISLPYPEDMIKPYVYPPQGFMASRSRLAASLGPPSLGGPTSVSVLSCTCFPTFTPSLLVLSDMLEYACAASGWLAAGRLYLRGRWNCPGLLRRSELHEAPVSRARPDHSVVGKLPAVHREHFITQEGAIATLLVVDVIYALTVQDQGVLGRHPGVPRNQ